MNNDERIRGGIKDEDVVTGLEGANTWSAHCQRRAASRRRVETVKMRAPQPCHLGAAASSGANGARFEATRPFRYPNLEGTNIRDYRNGPTNNNIFDTSYFMSISPPRNEGGEGVSKSCLALFPSVLCLACLLVAPWIV